MESSLCRSKACSSILEDRESGSGNKGNFESSLCRSKACSSILEDRESNPVFVTMEQHCSSFSPKEQHILATH